MNSNNIDFVPIPSKFVNDLPFSLDATATSSGNVQFTLISGPAELVNGVVTIKGAGMVTIQASCEGNAYFDPAEPVTRSFLIATVLPLGLKDLTGALDNGGVLLHWSTANSSNISHFTIERSIDGVQFIPVGFINVISSTQGTGKYNFNDKAIDILNVSRIYYRIAESDKAGKQSFSNVISIKTDHLSKITVYPNPTEHIINISFSKLPGDNSYIKIYDMGGRMVMLQKLSNQVSQKVTLPITNGGSYKLCIWSHGKLDHQQSLMINTNIN